MSVGGFLADPAVWAIAAIAFMLLELVAPGFLLLGFGLGALAMAGAVWAWPALPALGAAPALLAWAALSLAAWALLARRFGRRARRGGARDINDFGRR